MDPEEFDNPMLEEFRAEWERELGVYVVGLGCVFVVWVFFLFCFFLVVCLCTLLPWCEPWR